MLNRIQANRVERLTASRFLLSAGLLILVSLVASFIFYLVLLYSWTLEQQLSTRFFQQSFNASVEQFEYLPALLANDRDVKNALTAQTIKSVDLNQRLNFVAERSGANAVYLMDSSGRVIATSNYNTKDSFLNKNYAFRPYFSQAIRQKKRQFYYAVGATTGIPGLFISEPVINDFAQVVGVTVVKLNLNELEKNWRDAGQNILVTDENNVIILSGQAQWRYRSIGDLSKETLDKIDSQRQFKDSKPTALAQKTYEFVQLKGLSLFFWVIDNNTYLSNSSLMPDTGWRLYYLEKNQRFVQSALIFFIIVLTGISLSYLYFRERQSKLRSRRQTELVQQSKVAALGKMAATIVHELSQPLSAMNSSITATQLKARKEDWQGALNSIARLSPLSEKMNNIIKLLKFFSYQDDQPVQVQELGPLIEKSLALYKDKLKASQVVIHQHELQSAVFVRINPLKFELVIANLIQNAIDAMEKHDEPKISVAMTTQASIAIITIDDCGEGIDSRMIGQLFDPYFTTKEIGKGLGLGLSICHEIISEFGGRIDAENIDQGSRFTIILPLDKIQHSGQIHE